MFGYLTQTGEDAFATMAARPSDVLVAVDYDGTLAPMVDDPEQAHPDPGALAGLGRVGSLVGQVAIVTGRPVETCLRLGGFGNVPGLERLIVLGQYGVERWDASSGEFQIPPAPAAVRQAVAELPALLAEAGWPQARIEDKGRAVAVHTRELADAQLAFEALSGPVTRLASSLGLQVEPGRLVLEVRSATVADKGMAMRALVDEVDAKVVVFAGDDLGDIAAFEAVREFREQGLAGILVHAASEEQPALAELADISCDGPAGVGAWLGAAADAIESRPRPVG